MKESHMHAAERYTTTSLQNKITKALRNDNSQIDHFNFQTIKNKHQVLLVHYHKLEFSGTSPG